MYCPQNPINPPDGYHDKFSAARFLGVSPHTIVRWGRFGKFPSPDCFQEGFAIPRKLWTYATIEKFAAEMTERQEGPKTRTGRPRQQATVVGEVVRADPVKVAATLAAEREKRENSR
ncbi:hypothetical protein [uncultured Rhodospira sp.]|uniref:hypothetical protein n=1 Tax=uncultured Rhodospira sp. TaxID=1936189 RepID=UPI0026083482|nr:hypothetical protein [uncultured Rhodospira sp.]